MGFSMTWPLGAISRDATGARFLAPTLGHDPGPQLTCIITSTLGLQYIGDFDTIALKDLAISHVSKNSGGGLSRNQTNNWFPDGLSCDHQRSKWFYNVIIWQQFGAQAYAATRLPPTCCIHSLANHQSFVSNHCVKNSSYARIGGAKSIHSARNYRRIQTFCLWILDTGEWYEPTYSISLTCKSSILKIIWRQQINVNQNSDRDYTIEYCLVSLCSEWGSIK